ncbi:MAG: ABC transporter permease [Chloroflexi bacterium]|nr:ABC transporter permease [Chloroflexota bacterium]
MATYLLRRLAISIPVLLGITLAVYVIISLAPGDPVDALVNPEQVAALGPDFREQQRQALGLNQPIIVRYGIWLREAAHGNLGYSFVDRRSIAAKLGERVLPTLGLMSTALILAIIVAVPLGVLSAIRQYSLIDYTATVLGFAAISVPSFFLSLAGIYMFALKIPILPAAGMVTVAQPWSVADFVWHLALPAVVLGLAEAAPLIRYTRSSMLEVIRQEYVRAARAKGLRESAVIYQHALRNAMIPLVTVIALGLPRLFGGAVIVEAVFAWPGIGTLALTAVQARDYPVIMAINLISAVAILLSNLLADMIYAVIDPRIRYA